MDSAPGQNDRYICYILAIRDGPLPVTAELIEMAQYSTVPLSAWKSSLGTGPDPDQSGPEIPKTIKDQNRSPVFGPSRFLYTLFFRYLCNILASEFKIQILFKSLV